MWAGHKTNILLAVSMYKVQDGAPLAHSWGRGGGGLTTRTPTTHSPIVIFHCDILVQKMKIYRAKLGIEYKQTEIYVHDYTTQETKTAYSKLCKLLVLSK